MHDEVTCEQCAKSCQLIYGKTSDVHLTDYMKRQQGDALYVNAAGNLIKLTSDPTLKPGEFRIEQDDVPIQWVSPARAVTVPSANVSTTCARCSHAFKSRPDAANEDYELEDEIAAHQERCLIVGDWLRFDNGKDQWVEGPVTTLLNGFGHPEIQPLRESGMPGYLGRGYSFTWPDRVGNIRRIPRPQQGVARHAFVRGPSGSDRLGPPDETCAVCQRDPRSSIHHREACKRPHSGLACGCAIDEPIRSAHTAAMKALADQGEAVSERTQCCICGKSDTVSWECDHGQAAQITPPAPVLYDGLTARECWHRWADNAYMIEQRGPQALHAMTPAQIAAAKVENVVAMKAWPERLRAKIAASAEAERNQVRCELQCDEDEPW